MTSGDKGSDTKKNNACPTSLADYNLHFNENGELLFIDSGQKFEKGSRTMYQNVKRLVSEHIRHIMEEKYHLVPVPYSHGTLTHLLISEETQLEPYYTSKDLKTSKKVLLILRGAGAGAGVWSEFLCISEGLQSGSMLPYIKKALSMNYAIVIPNPNLNCYRNDDRNKVYMEHLLCIWKDVISQAETIDIVAFSYGGVCALHLLSLQTTQFVQKVKHIAFVESVHDANKHIHQNV